MLSSIICCACVVVMFDTARLRISFLLLLLCGSGVWSITQTGTGFWIQELSARLTADQVVNRCQTSVTHSGAGGCIINRGASPTSVRCEIVHTVGDLVDITINEGDPGTEGFVIHHFTQREFFGFFQGEIVRSTFFLTEDDDDQDEIPFLNGNWYVQITSESCPNGALRGQFTSEYNVASLLRGFNEVPPISSPDQGYALGNYNPAPDSRTLETFIEHTLQEATTATINQGAALMLGEEIFEYSTVSPPMSSSIDLSTDHEEELYKGNLYYNIRSENFPRGEIRDQLHVIDAIPEINYLFRLDSSQVVPQPEIPSSSKGYAMFSVNCDTLKIEYMIVHDVANPQTISLHFGGSGQEGISIHLLNGIVSPVLGNVTLSTGQYVSLLSQSLYVEIVSEETTGDFPIIRGQVTNQYNHYAYLSGTQEVPSVTTAAKGMVLMNLLDDEVEYILHYDNIASIQSIDLYSGVVGVNGERITEISNSGTSTRQGSFSLSSEEATRFSQGETYISIASSRFTNGEIRGQVLSNFPSCAFPPVIPVSEVSIAYSDSSSSSSSGSVIVANSFLFLLAFILFL